MQKNWKSIVSRSKKVIINDASHERMFPFAFNADFFKFAKKSFNHDELSEVFDNWTESKNTAYNAKYSFLKLCRTVYYTEEMFFGKHLLSFFIQKILANTVTKKKLQFIKAHTPETIYEDELYYYLLALRDHAVNNLPFHDIYLLAANNIYVLLQKEDHIFLANWSMLPTIFLLLPILYEGIHITLPPWKAFLDKKNYALLWDFLTIEFPYIVWHGQEDVIRTEDAEIIDDMNLYGYIDIEEEIQYIENEIRHEEWRATKEGDAYYEALYAQLNHADDEKEYNEMAREPRPAKSILHECPQDSLILGSNPMLHYISDDDFIQKIQNIRGGIFYTNLDFLHAWNKAQCRRSLVKNKLVQCVLQLPRPRRAKVIDYPAVILMQSQNTTQDFIRMAHIDSLTTYGIGALDMHRCAQLLYAPIHKTKEVCNTSLHDIMSTKDCRLTPLFYLTEKNVHTAQRGESVPRRLDCYAEVLRCQVTRKKYEKTIETIGKLDEKSDIWIVREVAINELEEITTFLQNDAGKFVQICLNTMQEKYLLRPHDIIFAFRGSVASIGKSGFVVGKEADSLLSIQPSITGPATCIIRPREDVDAVWLFYQLKGSKVQEWIRGQVSSSSVLSINLETIRNIPLETYDALYAQKCDQYHKKLLASWRTMQKAREEILQIVAMEM